MYEVLESESIYIYLTYELSGSSKVTGNSCYMKKSLTFFISLKKLVKSETKIIFAPYTYTYIVFTETYL